MRKGALFAIASYAASPKGRRRLRQLRDRLDTPANRQKVVHLKDQVASRARRRGAAS